MPAIPAAVVPMACFGLQQQQQQLRTQEQLHYVNNAAPAAAAGSCLVAARIPAAAPAGNENKTNAAAAASQLQLMPNNIHNDHADVAVDDPHPHHPLQLHPRRPITSASAVAAATSTAVANAAGALSRDHKKDVNGSSDSGNMYWELWHACAGPLVSLPRIGSRVLYFPQGHLEQVAASLKQQQQQQQGNVADPRPILPVYEHLPSQIVCRVADLSLHADRETDEVFAQFTLVPLPQEREKSVEPEFPAPPKLATHMFCKALTISDTSTHGGFSVPRRAADECFPPLDYSQQRPSQEIVARDLHGVDWRFRHIYRGQPRRHLLTTGWSLFVSSKKLVAGDSVLFLRKENGELWVGLRRGWRTQAGCNGPMSVLSSHTMHMGVLAAAAHAVSTKSMFNVYYNPRTSPSAFVISHHKYRKAFSHALSVGMRFKMRFEAEDGNERRYTGTITGIGDIDPGRWRDSKWRSLKVNWDEQTSAVAGGCISNYGVQVVGGRRENVSPWEIEPFLASAADLDIPNYNFMAHGLQFMKRHSNNYNWSGTSNYPPPSIQFEFSGSAYASSASFSSPAAAANISGPFYGGANYTKYLHGNNVNLAAATSRLWPQRSSDNGNLNDPSSPLVTRDIVDMQQKHHHHNHRLTNNKVRDPLFSDHVKRLRFTDPNATVTSFKTDDDDVYLRRCGSTAESLGTAPNLSSFGALATTGACSTAAQSLVLGQQQVQHCSINRVVLQSSDAGISTAAAAVVQGSLLRSQQHSDSMNGSCAVLGAEASSSRYVHQLLPAHNTTAAAPDHERGYRNQRLQLCRNNSDVVIAACSSSSSAEKRQKKRRNTEDMITMSLHHSNGGSCSSSSSGSSSCSPLAAAAAPTTAAMTTDLVLNRNHHHHSQMQQQQNKPQIICSPSPIAAAADLRLFGFTLKPMVPVTSSAAAVAASSYHSDDLEIYQRCSLDVGPKSDNNDNNNNNAGASFFFFEGTADVKKSSCRSADRDAVESVVTGKGSDDVVGGTAQQLETNPDGNAKVEQNLGSDSHMHTASSNCRNRVKVMKKGHPVGRSLDLSALSGYGELRQALEKLFAMEAGELTQNGAANCWQITYTDNEGDVMLVGDDPWPDFVDVAVKICISRCRPRDEVHKPRPAARAAAAGAGEMVGMTEEDPSHKSSEDSSSPAKATAGGGGGGGGCVEPLPI